MRAKRQQNKERIAEANGHVGARVQPNYWHADTIFVDGATVDESDGADRLGASELVELYSHLELGPDADLAAITEAYRRLAKRHHPDRWATADPATQAHHEQQMLAVNRAYRLLRAELDADTHR
ncbi:MAG: J domain-containing protein [Acidimicrobiia bacterium]|nr:J domain-containing protein [Acidimicrobiia bacterium]